MSANNRSFGARVNSWLEEAPHEQFQENKWKFWWPALLGLQALAAALTAVIFGTDSNLQSYMGGIILALGALLGWLGLGALFYSDGPNRQLARSVAALDSVTLLFAAGHVCFLLWALGHLYTIRGAEAKYELAAATYNAKAEKVSGDKVAIALAQRDIAKEQTKQRRLESDAAFQLRRAAEAGVRVPRPGSRPGSTEASGSGGLTLDTSAPELERPVKPEKSSSAFLNEWDAYIRAMNFGELALAILTLIVIRNVSAASNSPGPTMDFNPLLSVASRTPAPVGNLTKKKEPAQNHASSKFNPEGLNKLREALRDISFKLHKRSFKTKVKNDCVWIFLVRARSGTQETISSTRASLQILNDALTMSREDFALRLTQFLKARGFEI